jgi:hypothetical protein
MMSMKALKDYYQNAKRLEQKSLRRLAHARRLYAALNEAMIEGAVGCDDNSLDYCFYVGKRVESLCQTLSDFGTPQSVIYNAHLLKF